MEDYLRITIQTYNQIASSYIDTTGAIRPQQEFDMLTKTIMPRGLVLDVGCAWGRDTKALIEKGFSTIGVDLSEGMLKVAKSLSTDAWLLQADLRYLPIPDGAIDGIWCCATLLHLRRDQIIKGLTEFKRVLKKGATCYFQVKKGHGEEITGGDFSQGKPRFFTYFQQDELHQICLSAGLTVIDEHTYNERERHGSKGRDQDQLCFLVTKTQKG